MDADAASESVSGNAERVRTPYRRSQSGWEKKRHDGFHAKVTDSPFAGIFFFRNILIIRKDFRSEMKMRINVQRINVFRMTVTAVMAAVAFVLMVLEFSVPFVPEFLKFDFSDLPAMITSFTFGPVSGVVVELIKNLLHLPLTKTAGVGELANFLVGSALVLPAGLIYRFRKNKKGALLGALSGTVFAALISFPVNYFITYPFYTGFMPMETILSMYKTILPAADTLPKALLIFNVPFTIVKGVVNTVITFAVYKKLSPILKGTAGNGSLPKRRK